MHDNLSIPICQTSVNEQKMSGHHQPYTYARDGNPTVTALEAVLADLETAQSALCFSSGMSAITTLLLTLLREGDHVLCDKDVYPGTARLLLMLAQKYRISVSWIDMANPNSISSAIQQNSRIVYFETPCTPSLKVIDIEAISSNARQHGLLVIVDNTILTPALQKPIALGADISLYSTTKYIDGHNATLGGAIVLNNMTIMNDIKYMRNAMGTIQSPGNAWLILQGIKTLHLRMQQHSDNAWVVAHFLSSHKNIDHVAFPGLTTFPGHVIATRQQQGWGGVVSFVLSCDQQTIHVFLNALKVCRLAGSFGSTTTLITHPASMFDLPANAKEQGTQTLPYNVLRLSLGLEKGESIIEDLREALSKL